MGAGTTAVAAILHGRKSAGAEIKEEYLSVALERIKRAGSGNLKTRAMGRPIYCPSSQSNLHIQ